MFVLRKQAAWLGTSILLGFAAAAQAQVPRHLTVVDLLRVLTGTGVDVIYSSELVPSTLQAPDSLPPSDPLARAVAALTAHHLMLQSTGARSYIVTRAAVNPAPAAAAAPIVVQPASRESALDEISVFSSRYEFTTAPANEAIGFDQREIAQMPGATADSVRALRAAPGWATNLSARPYVRGAQLDDVLVEYDGIAFFDPFHFRDFQSVLSVFNPATVSRADVFTGGFPVKYGTRSGGVIDLAPRSSESGSEYVISASLLSYDLATVGRSDSLPIDWLFVARVSSDDRVLQRMLSEVGEPQFYDVIGDIRWTVDPASCITFGWLLLRDKVSFDSSHIDELAMGSSRDFSGWLRWDWTPTDALKSHTSLAAANTQRQNTGTLWLPGLAEGSLNAERTFSDLALQSDWTYSSAVVWNFGGEFRHENADLMFFRQETIYAPLALSLLRPLDASVSLAQSPHASTLGLYSSAHRRWQAFEGELGVRFDAQDYQGYGVRSQGSTRLNLRYDLTDRWHAYGSWGQFTQAQRIDEYRTEAGQTTPDSASRAQHSSVGITHDGADTTGWRLEGYRHHWSTISPYFDNALGPLSIVPQLEPDRVLVVPADADSTGLEISAQRSFGHGFSAWGSYSFSRVTDGVNGREMLRSWDQEHAGNLGLSWTKRGNSASVLFGWHSGWPRTPVAVVSATSSQPAYLAVGTRNSARWGSYLSADLRLSTIISLPRGELSLWLDGTNITNELNNCCVDLDSTRPPGNVPTLETVAWLPRVINVGFSWRVGKSQ